MKTKKHVIDTSKKPNIPNMNLEIESHDTSMGVIDIQDIVLHCEPEQEKGYLSGELVQQRLQGRLLNATVLQYFLEHTSSIPKDWKYKYIFFDGTIFRDPSGERCALCLCLDGDGAWDWVVYWLDFDRSVSSPSAVLASPLSSVTQTSSDTRLLSFVSELKSLIEKYEVD